MWPVAACSYGCNRLSLQTVSQNKSSPPFDFFYQIFCPQYQKKKSRMQEVWRKGSFKLTDCELSFSSTVYKMPAGQNTPKTASPAKQFESNPTAGVKRAHQKPPMLSENQKTVHTAQGSSHSFATQTLDVFENVMQNKRQTNLSKSKETTNQWQFLVFCSLSLWFTASRHTHPFIQRWPP